MRVLFLFLFVACTQNSDRFIRLEIDIQGNPLPILIEKEKDELFLHNSDDKTKLIKVDDLTYEIPPYESALQFDDKNLVTGNWIRYHRTPEFKIPFKGKSISKPERFSQVTKEKFQGEYEISLGEDKVLGTFKTIDGVIKGSIIAPYGDFGHIEGFIDENKKIHLYSFNGIFSYVFHGKVEDHKIINGKAFASLNWQESFNAVLNPDFKVSYPKTEEILIEPNTNLSFKVESLRGDIYQYQSSNINKVQIVQIFGSWCPNCQDETIFFNSWYPKYKDQVELIAIAFERSPSKAMAIKSIRKTLSKLKPIYPFFLATHDSKEEVSTIMPQVKKLTAYPTTFILDKKGKVRFVHIGFNGPQTGHHYDQFVEKFQNEIDELLAE